jgi:hypothetical protein
MVLWPSSVCTNLEIAGLAQRARSRGVAQVMDPRVDAGIDPFALVGTDAVIGDRIALTLEFFSRRTVIGIASIVLWSRGRNPGKPFRAPRRRGKG